MSNLEKNICIGVNKQQGFTLIEILIAVAIIGILGAIAYPAYMDSLRKGRRADAQAYLLDLSQRQQQYFSDNRAYATTIDGTGLNVGIPSKVSSYYTLTVPIATTATPPKFTLTLTAISSQVPDGDLSIDSTGAKSPASKW